MARMDFEQEFSISKGDTTHDNEISINAIFYLNMLI